MAHVRKVDWGLQLFIGVMTLMHKTNTFSVNYPICDLVSLLSQDREVKTSCSTIQTPASALFAV